MRATLSSAASSASVLLDDDAVGALTFQPEGNGEESWEKVEKDLRCLKTVAAPLKRISKPTLVATTWASIGRPSYGSLSSSPQDPLSHVFMTSSLSESLGLKHIMMSPLVSSQLNTPVVAVSDVMCHVGDEPVVSISLCGGSREEEEDLERLLGGGRGDGKVTDRDYVS